MKAVYPSAFSLFMELWWHSLSMMLPISSINPSWTVVTSDALNPLSRSTYTLLGGVSVAQFHQLRSSLSITNKSYQSHSFSKHGSSATMVSLQNSMSTQIRYKYTIKWVGNVPGPRLEANRLWLWEWTRNVHSPWYHQYQQVVSFSHGKPYSLEKQPQDAALAPMLMIMTKWQCWVSNLSCLAPILTGLHKLPWSCLSMISLHLILIITVLHVDDQLMVSTQFQGAQRVDEGAPPQHYHPLYTC